MASAKLKTEPAARSLEQGSPPEPIALYIHIPFCDHECPYCDFLTSMSSVPWRSRYLNALRNQIRQSPWARRVADTVFLGGGTPSQLNSSELNLLVETLHDTFQWTDQPEWSLECNPDPHQIVECAAWRKLGFNRISLGVQSFQDELLKILGRTHSAEQARAAARQLRQSGFDNINLELLFGIPGQDLRHWRSDLDTAIQLEPEHLSIYGLTTASDSPFARRIAAYELREPDRSLKANMYEAALDDLEKAGYIRYEISHFSLPGRQCRHQLAYWSGRDYLGFGVGAASRLSLERWTNTRSFEAYCAPGPDRSPRTDFRRLSPREDMLETLLASLRTATGADLVKLSCRYALDLPEAWSESLQYWSRQGLLTESADGYKLTRSGLMDVEALTEKLRAELLPTTSEQ